MLKDLRFKKMKINWSGYSKKRKKQQAVHGYLHVTTMNKAQALNVSRGCTRLITRLTQLLNIFFLIFSISFDSYQSKILMFMNSC